MSEWFVPCPFLQKTSFILFLNKFDLFEKKVLKVRLQLFFIFYFFYLWTTSTKLVGISCVGRYRWMFVSGSRITNQFQQKNKKLSMLMSEFFLVTSQSWRNTVYVFLMLQTNQVCEEEIRGVTYSERYPWLFWPSLEDL